MPAAVLTLQMKVAGGRIDEQGVLRNAVLLGERGILPTCQRSPVRPLLVTDLPAARRIQQVVIALESNLAAGRHVNAVATIGPKQIVAQLDVD